MNPNYLHLVYLDLLYNCLTLTEDDARALIRLNTPDPFTYPDDYKVKELAGTTWNTITTSIGSDGKRWASSQYSDLWYQCVRSIPSDTAKLIICDYLSKEHRLEGVPGFYQSGNRWRLNISGQGFLKPYRDERNKIMGLFIYRGVKDHMPGLLTSEGLYKGTPAIQPIEQEERAVA